MTLAAAALRFWGIGFGLPQTFTRPDEETIASVTGRILRSGPNPGFFRYPTLFIYVMAAIDRVRFGAAASVDDASVYLGARVAAALLGTATVPLLYAVARRLLTPTGAMIAAALLAVAFLHVRDSHFGVTDVPATFIIVAAFAAIVFGPLDGPTRRNVAVAGLLCGLAASTKYNAGLILIALVCAAPSVPLTIVATASAAFGFLAGSPYALLARRQFVAELTAESSHLATGHGIAAGIGWIEHLAFSLRFGLGPLFLAAAVAGALMLAVRDRRRSLPVLAFPIAYYIVMGAGRSVFVRYMTPLVPFAALMAAHAVDRCAWLASQRFSRAGYRVSATILCAAVAADSATRSIALDRLLARPDSRAIAAEIVRARYPRGASVYQTGAGYGQVMLTPESQYPQWPLAFLPRLVIVQTSRLYAYSHVPETLQAELSQRYRLIEKVEVENLGSGAIPVFDQQDAFFVPLSGFDRMVRPGPAIAIYERVQ